MIVGLIAFAIFLAILLYVAGVFVAGNWVQEWAEAHGWPPVATPWVFSMLMLFGLPGSIIVGLLS